MAPKFDHVDYDTLDAAKLAFIEAAKKTLKFAPEYGQVPVDGLGASANLFALDLTRFAAKGGDKLFLSLIPEGLGTADDARPEDLNERELTRFWHHIAYKVLSCLSNDAASGGLHTLLIGLYLPSSTPELVFTQSFRNGFLSGIVEGCQTLGCVYLSGETPQLKTKMVPGKLDCAGAAVGIYPPEAAPIRRDLFGAGNTIVLVGSSGPHENGFTTLRALASRLPEGYRTKLPSGVEYWDALNQPSVLYAPLVEQVLTCGISPTNLEHITGHGWQKLMRDSRPLRYVIEEYPAPPEIFPFVEQQLKITTGELLSVFNYGSGFAFFLDSRESAEEVVRLATSSGYRAVVAGRVESAGGREVVVPSLGVSLSGDNFALAK